VCNAGACKGCTFTSGDGSCAAGNIALGLDPNEACEFACDGQGACDDHDLTTVELSWDRLFDARYAYNIFTTGGEEVPCKNMNQATKDIFDGICTQPSGRNVPLSEVAAFRFYTTMDCWQLSDPSCNIGMIEVPYTGQARIYAHETPPQSCPDLAGPNRPNQRDLLVLDLADPDVFNDGCRILLSGTEPAPGIGIYESTDAVHHSFTKVPNPDDPTAPTTYAPSVEDPAYDYSGIWDASIERVGGLYVLLFTALRTGEGTQGERMAFVAFARDSSLDFGAPMEIHFPEGDDVAPHSSSVGSDQKAVRIGARLFYDDLQERWWFAYNWFNWTDSVALDNRGNWGVACAVDDPTHIITNTWPVAGESHVAEGPEIFRWGSDYFYCFSYNPIFRGYGIKCLKRPSVDLLQRDGPPPPGVVTYDPVTPIHPLSAVCNPSNTAPDCGGTRVVPDPALLGWEDAGGRPAALRVNGEMYLYYHVLQHQNFDCPVPVGNPDNAGCRRHTVVSKLQFNQNDDLFRLNRVEIDWNAMGDPTTTQYSLDLVLTDGTVVAPCVHAGILGSSHSFRYDGACADGELHHKGDIAKFRLWVATDGVWGDGNNSHWDVDYNGYFNQVHFENE